MQRSPGLGTKLVLEYNNFSGVRSRSRHIFWGGWQTETAQSGAETSSAETSGWRIPRVGDGKPTPNLLVLCMGEPHPPHPGIWKRFELGLGSRYIGYPLRQSPTVANRCLGSLVFLSYSRGVRRAAAHREGVTAGMRGGGKDGRTGLTPGRSEYVSLFHLIRC